MDESLKLKIMRNIITVQIDWYIHFVILSENIEEYSEINDLLVQLSTLNVLDRDFRFAFRKMRLLHKGKWLYTKYTKGVKMKKLSLNIYCQELLIT